MSLVTLSIIFAAAIYLVYNVVAMYFFGIPHSLSMTYYLYKDNYQKGFIFPMMMFLIVAFMMPAWVTMSEGTDFQFLAFLAPAAIAFVGAAPAFLSGSLESRVHEVSACLAAAFSLLWIISVTPYWWTIIAFLFVVALAAYFTKTIKTSYIFWLETIAFASTFTSAIIYSI